MDLPTAVTHDDDKSCRLGASIFLSFAFLMGVSQALSPVSMILAQILVAAAIAVTIVTFIAGDSRALAIALILISLTRMTIPSTDREFQELLLPPLSGLLLLKSVRQRGLRSLAVTNFAILYFAICIVAFFSGLKGPQGVFSSVVGESSGFRARWTLISTVVLFFSIRSSFSPKSISRLLRLLVKFYVAIIIVCFAMLVFGIDTLPLFNTFSWSVLHETPTSSRFGILGAAALSLSTILLPSPMGFVSRGRGALIAMAFAGVILSGGRGTLFAFFIVCLLWYAMKNGKIVRTAVIGFITIVGLIIFSNSIFVTYLPSSIQRQFILLPSEIYEDSVPQISKEAAASSSSWRYAIWALAIDKILENPITGTGFGLPSGIPAQDQTDGETSVNDFLVMGNTHNTFISIAYIMGIPAMLVFASWLVYLFVCVNRLWITSNTQMKMQAAWLFLLLVSQVVNAFSSDIHTGFEFIIAVAITESLLGERSTSVSAVKEAR